MITPRATEKAYAAQTKNQYIFFVPKAASKQAIAKAISEEFKVTVLGVRVANRKGKATRFSRGKHAYPGITYREDRKVAYITVKDGDKIPVFDEPKSANAKEDVKENKKTEKAEKKEKKATKKASTKAEKETK